MKAQHTQRPWKVEYWKEQGNWGISGPVEWVAMIAPQGQGKRNEKEEANARLIAAAPDLLAALKGIMEGVGDGCECMEGEGRCFYCMARDAIVRAESSA